MFTGLVQTVGRIERVERRAAGAQLTIGSGAIDCARLNVGDSIAVNGCCLTATVLQENRFCAEVSAETLSCTANLDRCGDVNLELSLTLADRLGGHLVSGHVDGVGTVVHFAPVGSSHLLKVRAPVALAPCLAFKGSVAVDGVSLTINAVEDVADGCEVSINLIPHTLSATTLGALATGQRVNLEVDLLARYAQRMMSLLTIDPAAVRR